MSKIPKQSTRRRVAERRTVGKANAPSSENGDVALILAENIARMMRARGLASDPVLARLAGCDQKTVWRIRKRAMSPSVRLVEAIAHALGLHAWQLLAPGLDPDRPPHPMRRATDRLN